MEPDIRASVILRTPDTTTSTNTLKPYHDVEKATNMPVESVHAALGNDCQKERRGEGRGGEEREGEGKRKGGEGKREGGEDGRTGEVRGDGEHEVSAGCTASVSHRPHIHRTCAQHLPAGVTSSMDSITMPPASTKRGGPH